MMKKISLITFYLLLTLIPIICLTQEKKDSILVQKQIKTVKLKASRKTLIERKVDRLVFNVENSISATGGDALDALKITPGLKVQGDQIMMIAKKGMSVMIDDKLIQLSGDDLINFLKTIKSEDIKSIEVITNPPAKYDAEGNSGLVNIKLKRIKQDSWSITINGSQKQSIYSTGSIGGSFNYQKNKLSLTAAINYTNGSKKGTEEEFIVYPDQQWNNYFKKRNFSDILSSKLSMDYNISKNWSLGVQYLTSYSTPYTKLTNQNTIYNNHHTIDSLLTTNSFDHKKINTNAINVHSTVKLDSLGKNISFDLDYLGYDNKNNRNFQTQSTFDNASNTPFGYTAANNIGLQNIKIYSMKVDFENPLKWIMLKYGAKFSFLKTNYDNKYYDTSSGISILDPNISNIFNYVENTQAIYIMGEKNISEKWKTQLGLRVENTQTKGNSVTLNELHNNNYTEFFPSAYLMYKANDNHNISLNYNRRLSRPRYNELNPFKVYYNPYSYTEGNPYIRPEFIDNIEFQYSYKDILFSSFSYSHTKNGKGNPPFFDDVTKVLRLQDLNFFSSNVYNLSETYIFNKVKWWESYNQANVYYTEIYFLPNLNLTNTKNWGAYFSSNNKFTINKNKTLKAEVNFWYQSPQNQDSYKFKGSASLGLGFTFITLKKAMIINLVINDLFMTEYEKARALTSTPYRYASYDDQRYIRLSVSYRFGNNKLSVKKRSVGNEEEKGRIDN